MKNKKKFDSYNERWIDKRFNLSMPYNISHRTMKVWKNTYLIFQTKPLTKEQLSYIKSIIIPYKGKIWCYDKHNQILLNIVSFLEKYNQGEHNRIVFVMYEKNKRMKKKIVSSFAIFLNR